MGVEESCTRRVLLVEEKLCTFGKGCLSSGVQGICCGCTQVKKGKSQAVGLGTGCRSQGPNQDNSPLFAFVFSVVISCDYFIYCK